MRGFAHGREPGLNALETPGEFGIGGAQSGFGDQLQMARLKKRKLALRDRIAAIEDVLIPDIIA